MVRNVAAHFPAANQRRRGRFVCAWLLPVFEGFRRPTQTLFSLRSVKRGLDFSHSNVLL